MSKLLLYLKNRSQEASTWRGIIMLSMSLLGYTTSPDVTEAIVLIAMSLSGGVGIVAKED
jgi:hypothetical protein